MGEFDSTTPPGPMPTAATPGATPASKAAMAADPVDAAQRRARLNRIAGPGQLQAEVLALLLSPGRARELAVWRCSTVGKAALRSNCLAALGVLPPVTLAETSGR
jgi:hypothetical protein